MKPIMENWSKFLKEANVQEELGGMERGELARASMEPERPYAQNVLAAAIEAISQHQTQMGEPSNLLDYALEQLNVLMGHLSSGE